MVIPDFMIQGGDPTGTGSGSPDIILKMNLLMNLSMILLVFFPWQMQVLEQMEVSFS